MLTIALSKGRILNESLPLLNKIGIEIDQAELASRKLILDTNFDDIKVVILRAQDVPVYVQHGATDIGIAGKDVLLEHKGQGLYELLDLNIAKCKLKIAAKSYKHLENTPLKVATKYVNSARKYFQQQSRQVEIIKLYGAMELAPIINLADAIVDLVDTGNTLKANGLKAFDTIYSISSRLIVNSASYKTKNTEIKYWLNLIKSKLND